jgi:hypothetical protein
MSAVDDLTDLLAKLPGASLITPKMKQDALSGALVPDGLGVWPGQPGYMATYDVYWAAIGLVGFLAAQPVVKQSASEGTSITVEVPNWGGLTAWFSSMSRIAGAASTPLLQAVPIPEGRHVHRTDMSGRGDDYGNVDTDLG